MFIEEIFSITTWNQHKCPLTDEHIKKMWYVYTVEYYSLIKRSGFHLQQQGWMFSSVQFSRTVMSGSLWSHGLQHTRLSLSITNLRGLLKFMSVKSLMPSKHLILHCPLLLLPLIFPSIRVFSKESVLRIRWPKYWSFSLSISPSNDYSGMISFRIDLFDILAVQGTLKSLLQHHSSKASILQCSTLFVVKLSHPYMTTRKTIGVTRRNFFGKIMSLLFKTLSRLVITFLPRRKCLLISWLQSPSAVILIPNK